MLSRRLKVVPTATTLWLDRTLVTSPPPDLSISTSPDSYPTPIGSIPYRWTFKSSHIRMDHKASPTLLKPIPCCHPQHLKSAINPHHFYNPCNILCLILLTFSWNQRTTWCWVDKSLFYQKLCVVFRGLTMIPVVFAHKPVPGVGTKLSINFEPFLVLDQ